MRKIKITILCLILSTNIFSQNFHDEVSSVYNFSPSKLSSKEQKALFPILDKFFEKVYKDTAKYLEPLRAELKRNDNNPYFYFDGGMLLLNISQSDSDCQIVANAFTKADLKDLPPKVYLEQLLFLSLKGANVVDATLHILDDSTFNVFIPQHALTFKYGEGLKFILPRYPSEFYINKLIQKFGTINSVENKITCIDLFIYANCCEADVFLTSIKDDKTQDQRLRDKVEETIKQTTVSQSKNDKKYIDNFEKRKVALNRITDEAAYDLYETTLKMRKEYKCVN